MFVIFGLAFLNMFSIGLASHTMKFDIHYKTNLTNAFIFVALIAILSTGGIAAYMTNFHSLTVNPETIQMPKRDRLPMPPLNFAAADKVVQDGSIEFNESPWYQLNKKLQIAESCEGIPNPEENCNALTYRT